MAHQGSQPLNYLATHRRMLGYTQQDVAFLLGLRTPSQIARWERGERVPNLVHAILLARIYRVPVEALFRTLVVASQDTLDGRKAQLRPRQPPRHASPAPPSLT